MPFEQAPLPGAEPPARPRSALKTVIAGVLLVAGGLWLMMALLPRILSRETRTEPPINTPAATTARRIQANLFYVSDDGAELVQSVRDVAFGDTPTLQVKYIIEAQLAPPPSGFVSAIPAGTKVLGVFLGTHGDAYVDLSPEVVSGHSGGSLNEALVVFAIVNSVTSNLPDVSSVQILVAGKEVDSLAGHIDLREPLSRAQAWIRKGQ